MSEEFRGEEEWAHNLEEDALSSKADKDEGLRSFFPKLTHPQKMFGLIVGKSLMNELQAW